MMANQIKEMTDLTVELIVIIFSSIVIGGVITKILEELGAISPLDFSGTWAILSVVLLVVELIVWFGKLKSWTENL